MKAANAKYKYYDNPQISDIKELVELYKDSERIAFEWRDDGKLERRSFEAVYEDVKSLSSYFAAHYQGKNIAVIGENSYAWIICALALMLSGNVCVAIDKDLDDESMKKQMKIADVEVAYYSENYCEQVAKLAHEVHPLEELAGHIEEGKMMPFKMSAERDEPAMIFFTSGTTGFGKAVVLSQRNIARDLFGAGALFTPKERAVSFLPYHHAFGFVTSALNPYYYHITTYICGSLKHLMEDFQMAKPDTTFAVPMVIETFYKQIWRAARREKHEKKLELSIKLSNGLRKIGIDARKKFFKSILDSFGGNLEFIICGGAHLDKKYVQWFRSIGIEILNGYGITECSPVVSVNRNLHHRDGSIGQICRDVDVEIIDGEITVGGDTVMLGYYKDRKATEEVLKDGRFYTGDLGRIDEDGFLWITGRKKNLIILSNGENVSPEEIEGALVHEKGVSEVMAYEYENKIAVMVVPEKRYMGDQEYFDGIIYKYNQDKPKNRQIAMVRLRTETLPRNHNGKVLRDKVIKEENHEG